MEIKFISRTVFLFAEGHIKITFKEYADESLSTTRFYVSNKRQGANRKRGSVYVMTG